MQSPILKQLNWGHSACVCVCVCVFMHAHRHANIEILKEELFSILTS